MKNNMSKQINKNIYNFLIIFIIIIFIYIIYNFYNKKTYYSEIMCIGSGVSSAYACYQIKKHNINNNKIIVLEKDNNYGGRIKSVFSNVNKQNHLEVAYAELGAMRIFDIKPMKKIFDLLKVFGLKTINISLEDSDNIFYYNGIKYAKSEARLSNGIKVSEFEEYTINNLKNKYPDINFEEIFDYEELRNLNIKEFFEKYGNANNDDINMWIAYSGYNIYDYVDNIQVARDLYAKNFFNTKDKDKQYYILDGMIALVKKLFENSNAEIIYNTKAISIQKDSQGYNIINTINSNNVYEQYKCKYLFIGLTLKQMKELNTYQQIPISPLRLQMINEVISIPKGKRTLKIHLRNTNPSIFVFDNILISKTGFTSPAGRCVVMLVEKNGTYNAVVVLGQKNVKARSRIANDLITVDPLEKPKETIFIIHPRPKETIEKILQKIKR